MADVPRLLVMLHVAANLIWIGSIVAVGAILSSPHASPQDRGKLGLSVYRWVATPAFLGSFTLGLVRLVLALDFYFVQTKFMHGKLLFAVGIIALHHVLGGHAKRLAGGKSQAAPHSSLITSVLVVCAVATAYFAVVKPF